MLEIVFLIETENANFTPRFMNNLKYYSICLDETNAATPEAAKNCSSPIGHF